ncbi:MAG: TrmH family RNA methyltransferase [Pseudomonadota bacterium]|nr:TrmH family RNA methyltransferase [Pseudomonadota bacterium]
MTLATPPVVILVRPQLGENIGAAARAMMNCGLTDMRLVASRDDWPNPAALPMAAGGAPIIEAATVHDSVAEAAHDLTFLAALSARRRDMPVRTSDPRGVTADRLRHGGKAGLMFGPEASGLDNEDVVRADCLVTADLNPDYPSLNLAQAVLLMAWEWRSAATGAAQAEGRPAIAEVAADDMATILERDRFHERLEAELDSGGFFISPEMAPAVKRNLRALFGRARPTSQEISTLHGVIQALTKTRARSKSG